MAKPVGAQKWKKSQPVGPKIDANGKMARPAGAQKMVKMLKPEGARNYTHYKR